MALPLILVLCTGNSCRSQMAEYLLRKELEGVAEVASAGCCPSGYVHPLAIKAMQEIGYDLGDAHSKSHDLFFEKQVQTVITVCNYADTECPAFPGQMNRYHWPFYDPAEATGSDEEKLIVFRRVRDEIRAVLGKYAQLLITEDESVEPGKGLSRETLEKIA